MRKHFKPSSFIAFALVLVLTVSFALPGLATVAQKSIMANYRDITVTLDGTTLDLLNEKGETVEPFIVDGSTYLPLRAVANALGLGVEWDNDSSTVVLETPPEIGLLGFTPVAEDDDLEAFAALLTEITGVEIDAELHPLQMVTTAAGLDELANSLAAQGSAMAQAAVVAGLIPGNEFELTAASLNDIAYNVAEYKGFSRGYVGSISDDDIVAVLGDTIKSLPHVLNAELTEIAGKVLDANLITGFNIRHEAYDVNFDAERTIIYGHSNLKHAEQLVMLLKALEIDARVAIQPKTSWFYWEGLNYGTEFDMYFEFVTAENKLAFDGIIKDYAQRTRGVDEITWISDSWVDPVYTSTIEVDDQYLEIVNNVVRLDDSGYYLTSYGLNDDSSDAVVDMFEELGAQTEQSPLFANIRFHDYLVAQLAAANAE